MQMLKVVERLFPLVENGEKTSTIRWRELRIRPGLMVYECDTDPKKTVLVWVTACTDMPLSQAAEFVGRGDEWPDEVLLAGMREHYPEIELTDIVQVVEHLTPEQTRKNADFSLTLTEPPTGIDDFCLSERLRVLCSRHRFDQDVDRHARFPARFVVTIELVPSLLEQLTRVAKI